MKPACLALGLTLAALPLPAAETATPLTPAPDKSTASTDTSATVSKSEQLDAAQRELATMRLRYRETHPALIKQRTKVAQLQKATRAEEAERAGASRTEQLADAKRELARMLERYTEKHPVVIAQRRRIAQLEAKE